MKIRRAYKYRIYPNKQQQQQLAVLTWLKEADSLMLQKCDSLARSISDSGWNTFKLQCEYKACRYGSSEHSVDIFFPYFNTVGATELKACGEDVRPTTFLGARLTSVKQEANAFRLG